MSDPSARSIEGLIWLESVPPFEEYAIADDGMPVRMVTVDPRAFAAKNFGCRNAKTAIEARLAMINYRRK